MPCSHNCPALFCMDFWASADALEGVEYFQGMVTYDDNRTEKREREYGVGM